MCRGDGAVEARPQSSFALWPGAPALVFRQLPRPLAAALHAIFTTNRRQHSLRSEIRVRCDVRVRNVRGVDVRRNDNSLRLVEGLKLPEDRI